MDMHSEYRISERILPVMKRQVPKWMPFLILIAVASVLRLYRLPELIAFHDDQGMDLKMVRLMETTGYRPLTGPYLSVDSVFTPPTYYYITWLLHAATGTIPGVVYGYAFMNIMSLLLIMKLAHDIAGRGNALVTGILFSVSSAMIGHSRTFWQPYPMQLFLITSLLCLWHAISRKRAILLWISDLSFMIAVSVYPSAMLLLPFYLYQNYRWYRHVFRYPKTFSVVCSVCTVSISGIVPFIPQLFYETRHGMPSFHAYADSISVSGIPISDGIMKIGDNLVGLGTSFIPFDWAIFGQYRMVILLHVIGAAYLFRRLRLPADIGTFIPPWTLVAGLGALYFQTNAVYAHHTWAYLPFLFIISGYLVSRALGGCFRQKIAAYAFMLIFLLGNASDTRRFYSRDTTDTIAQVRAVAEFIRHDMTVRGIRQSDTVFFHTYPENGSYDTDVFYRSFYFLAESGTIGLTLTPAGNDFRLNPRSDTPKTDAYVICIRYVTDDEVTRKCKTKIPPLSGYGEVVRTKIGNMYVLALTRNDR